MFPYDFVKSQENGLFAGDDECTKHGFVFQKTVSSWRGTPEMANPFSSDTTVKTNTEVKSVDDFGRITSIALFNDSSRNDDDLCVQTVYATPTGTNERVLSAPASRTMMSSCDPATAVTLATQSWEYDTSPTGVKLPAGKVSAGRMTSQKSFPGGMPIPEPRFLTPAAPATSAPSTPLTTPPAAPWPASRRRVMTVRRVR